jgi:hypothetical protein
MSNFEEQLKSAAERAVLKIIGEGGWIAPDYRNRFELPPDFMAGVWGLVDATKLRQALATRLESELAERIVNHMAAEIASDVKQLLSIKERREELRSMARKYLDDLTARGLDPSSRITGNKQEGSEEK